MTTWPASLPNPSRLREVPKKGQIRAEFEAGYTQSRAKWTRTRRLFELEWLALTESEKSTLDTFFDNNLGGTFTWTHPVNETSYTVRFTDDELDETYVPIGRWRVRLRLEEQ